MILCRNLKTPRQASKLHTFITPCHYAFIHIAGIPFITFFPNVSWMMSYFSTYCLHLQFPSWWCLYRPTWQYKCNYCARDLIYVSSRKKWPIFSKLNEKKNKIKWKNIFSEYSVSKNLNKMITRPLNKQEKEKNIQLSKNPLWR